MKKHDELPPYALVEDYGYRTAHDVFNEADEEERYQAFKQRLINEVVARERSPHTALWIEQQLHDTMRGNDRDE